MQADQLGNLSNAVDNIQTDIGFTLRDEIILRVIQGLCSREDFDGVTPEFIADYALNVAQAVINAQKRNNGG